MAHPPDDWAARQVAAATEPPTEAEAARLRLRDRLLDAFRVRIGGRDVPLRPVLPRELDPPER